MTNNVEEQDRRESRVRSKVLPAGLLTGAGAADYLAWLGWDHRYHVAPNGVTSGPYETWQVAGLVLVLAGVVIGALWRGHGKAAVGGTTAGLTGALGVDWAIHDDSGLWAVGAVMVGLGTLAGTSLLALIVGRIRKARGK